ncbi:MAG: M14 family metallopeptidase [Longimicrobiales bacterium]|nr:M14 family metallopeptidase [Longimicrobiales bacterium]
MKWMTGSAVLAASTLFAGGLAAQVEGYRDFDAFESELRSVVGGSDLATMRSLGQSGEGRDVWLVQVADPSGPAVEQRPGVLVVGTLSGDHLLGSHLSVETIRHLVSGSSEADLSRHVFYILPRVNPDGAEAAFRGILDGRRGNATPYDDDNDGRTDEDGLDDLDGDGAVTVMRVADPRGEFMVHPDAPRLMKRADPAAGERGTHTLYLEGRDDDGDGFFNEDPDQGVDLDRNFQHAYPYWEADAGVNMVSEAESRALMDFVIAHGNIAAIVTFGHSDNLVTPPSRSGTLADAVMPELDAFAKESLDGVFDVGVYPVPRPQGLNLRGAQPGRDNDPNQGRRPAMTVNGADREYFVTVSDAYRELTGIDEVALNREAEGAFFQYGYFQFGVPSFSTPGWGLPDAGEEVDVPSSGDPRLLAAYEGAGIDVFADWTPHQHPDLGAVEIGGFLPYALVLPPADQLPALAEANAAFVARLSTMLPHVHISDAEVEDHGGGLYTVTVDVTNDGYFPSSLQHGIVSRTVDPVTVQIQVDQERIVTGAAKTHRIAQLEGSGSTERVSWVIRGNPGSSVEIRVRAQKGGIDSRTVQLGGGR